MSTESLPLLVIEDHDRDTSTTILERLDRFYDIFSSWRSVYVSHLVGCAVFIYYTVKFMSSHGMDLPSSATIWILGYAMQCLLYGIFLLVECVLWHMPHILRTIAKILDSTNVALTFVLGIIGFRWVIPRDPFADPHFPLFYRACTLFLAVDVLLMAIFILIPSIIAIGTYCRSTISSVTEQEVLSNEIIESLPRLKFRAKGRRETGDNEIKEHPGGVTVACAAMDSPIERFLSQEDASCCICRYSYKDADELIELPCQHYFHSVCIITWLHKKTNCPLCRHDVSKDDTSDIEIV